MRFRPMMKQFFWLFVIDCLILGYLGSQEPQKVFHLGGIDISALWPARLGTLYYFAFFWVIMPIVGLIETPRPRPDSIATAVLGQSQPQAAE
jgi:quinol-cytochrome oxidoreductase complex cytochrome b subunit